MRPQSAPAFDNERKRARCLNGNLDIREEHHALTQNVGASAAVLPAVSATVSQLPSSRSSCFGLI